MLLEHIKTTQEKSLNTSSPSRLNPLTATFAYYATFITLGATFSITGPALRLLAQHTSTGLDQISIIFVILALGYMLGSQLSGRAYDRFPGHRILALALLATSLTAALVPVLRSLWLLVGIFFLLGIVQGALDVGCNTLLTWIHGKKVGPFMNGLHFFFGAGSFLAPLIFARVVLSASGLQWTYWFFSFLALPVAAWLWFLPSPVIRKREVQESSGKPFNGMFFLIVFFFVACVGLEIGFGSWINTYSININLANETVAAYLTSAFWGAFTLGRLLGIGISTRLRPQAILVMDLSGCLVAFTVLLAWPDSSLALWIGTIVLGLSIASLFATAMAFAEQRLRLTGVLVGWILVGSGIGQMFLPWLIGQLFVQIGPRATMPILLVDTLFAFGVLLALILPMRKKQGIAAGEAGDGS
jgi:FHS family Na+ dependent glucose MFS transporter 1